jgi:hypothetical protein
MTTSQHAWIKEFPGAVTVCDPDGVILEMNDKSAKSFEKDGGYALVGKNMFECHSEASVEKLKGLMARRETNVYTIEKKGVKKIIYQCPWTLKGKYAGFVEISLEIPFELPHFVRD